MENPSSETEPKLSKKQKKKLEQQKKKDEAKQKRESELAAKKAQEDANDVSKGLYGDSPLNMSNEKPVDKKLTKFEDLKPNTTVWIRCRAESTRKQGGKLCFIRCRQQTRTLQAVVSAGEKVSTLMLSFVASISRESVVEIYGAIKTPDSPVESCTIKDLEIHVEQIFVTSRAELLPIQFTDCSRPQPLILKQKEKIDAIEAQEKQLQEELDKAESKEQKEELTKKLSALKEEKAKATEFVAVSLYQRLDNRVIDMRTAAHLAIFRIQSGVCDLFRKFLLNNKFVEIHSPKLISTASEGGATVFKLGYFNKHAYLAQSPQFYKQMAICGDFERVFEVGPVFRAEDSMTHRHMTEFTGLDFEMTFEYHYHEVMELFDQLFLFIFNGLNDHYRDEIEAVRVQYPFEDLKYRKDKSLVLQWPEIIKLLREEANIEIGDLDDINTTQEKILGGIILKKYGTEFYIVDKFPATIRPFYTMPDPHNKDYSNSYDVFLRGQEIMSGAQRVHDYNLLCERITEKGVDVETVRAYVDAFRYGAPPHAGGGVGLERVVMLFLNLYDIRQTSLFPRDPTRTTP